MRTPEPPFAFWPDGRYRPIPTQSWLNGNGDRAAFLMQVERHAFPMDEWEEVPDSPEDSNISP